MSDFSFEFFSNFLEMWSEKYFEELGDGIQKCSSVAIKSLKVPKLQHCSHVYVITITDMCDSRDQMATH